MAENRLCATPRRDVKPPQNVMAESGEPAGSDAAWGLLLAWRWLLVLE
jgi:hypothetical protein